MVMHTGLPRARAFTAKAACCSACILLTALPVIAYAGSYSGGSGEPNDPFQIATAEDLNDIGNYEDHWDKHFILTADIDVQGFTLSPIGYSAQHCFTGVFDGNDYVIRNMEMNMPASDYVGLFGYLGRVGQIKNLGVEATSIFGASYVGGLVGFSDDGTIINCYSSSLVSGDGAVGGLVGENFYGTIVNCHSSGSVNGTGPEVGGLVGDNYYGTAINCYSSNPVSGTGSYVGGLAGRNRGTIINCYSIGSVSGTGSYVGGLVGKNLETVSGSFWDVNTSGWKTSSGGTGKTTIQMQDIHTFLDSGWDFVKETANGTCSFWLMPESEGYPILSTLNGYIPSEPPGSGTETHPYIITDANELGTIWYRPSAHYLLCNDIDLVGINWIGPVVLCFNGLFDGNDHIIRNADVNMPGSDYVGLFGYLGADGQIKNLGVEDISIIGENRVGGIAGRNYGTISNCYSSGSVSGTGDYVGGMVGDNYYGTVINCYSTGLVSGTWDYVGGLVGVNDGTVTNCYSTASASSADYRVGGLVAWNIGTISNCYSTGPVSGEDAVGGLVGRNYGTISNCYSSGPVSGNSYVGGLVGDNYSGGSYSGIIINCYSTGSVSGELHLGGLVGWNSGPISNCYSTGLVSLTGSYAGGLVGKNWGPIISSFWDVNTCGWTKSAGGTPKTTAEMKTKSTFTSAKWDFVDEAANGTNDFWRMCVDGVQYPLLSWQFIPDFTCPDCVDILDLGFFVDRWLEGECNQANNFCSRADINYDAQVDFEDFAIFASYWLECILEPYSVQ